MIIVWGNIEARAGERDAMIKLSLEHVRRSRTEPGCIFHSVNIDVENSNRLVFVEEWETMEALQIHFSVAASVEFVNHATALAQSQPEIKIFDTTRLN